MIELIYTSVTPKPLNIISVREILETAKRNNLRNDITGHLFYDGHRFLQIIEGADETIYSLFNNIEADSRHQNVELLYEQEIDSRSFPDWQMAYEPLQAHSLNHPMQSIETINNNYIAELHDDPIQNFGAALFKVFKDSTVTP